MDWRRTFDLVCAVQTKPDQRIVADSFMIGYVGQTIVAAGGYPLKSPPYRLIRDTIGETLERPGGVFLPF